MRTDNELLAFVKSYQEAAEVEFTVMRLMCWVLAAGLAVVAVMFILSLSPAVAML